MPFRGKRPRQAQTGNLIRYSRMKTCSARESFMLLPLPPPLAPAKRWRFFLLLENKAKDGKQ